VGHYSLRPAFEGSYRSVSLDSRLLQNRRNSVIWTKNPSTPWIGYEDLETRGKNFKWCI